MAPFPGQRPEDWEATSFSETVGTWTVGRLPGTRPEDWETAGTSLSGTVGTSTVATFPGTRSQDCAVTSFSETVGELGQWQHQGLATPDPAKIATRQLKRMCISFVN